MTLKWSFLGGKTKEVMAVVRWMKPDAGGKVKDIIKKDEGARLLMLWWD